MERLLEVWLFFTQPHQNRVPNVSGMAVTWEKPTLPAALVSRSQLISAISSRITFRSIFSFQHLDLIGAMVQSHSCSAC